MKILSLATLLVGLSIGSLAQTTTPPSAPPPLAIVSYSCAKTHRSQNSSTDQVRKGTDAAIDQQIAIAQREAEAGNKDAIAEEQALRERKQNQVALIPRPSAVVNGYLYQAQVKNVVDKTIKGLQWSYVFSDSQKQQEVVRHQFYSRTQIRAGETKKVAAFTRGAPPGVIDAKEVSKNSGKVGNESIVIERVEFADGTVWVPQAVAAPEKPANDR